MTVKKSSKTQTSGPKPATAGPAPCSGAGPATILHTERLTLRPPRTSDLDDFYAIYGNPQSMRYWSTLPDPDKAATATRLTRMTDQSDGPRCYFAFVYQGRVIGSGGGGFHGNEVGFILHPDYWRQGFASEAMRAILPHIWAITDHADLWADADPRNAASVGLLKSLGFTETGRAENTFCINGEWVHSVYLGLKRPAA